MQIREKVIPKAVRDTVSFYTAILSSEISDLERSIAREKSNTGTATTCNQGGNNLYSETEALFNQLIERKEGTRIAKLKARSERLKKIHRVLVVIVVIVLMNIFFRCLGW